MSPVQTRDDVSAALADVLPQLTDLARAGIPKERILREIAHALNVVVPQSPVAVISLETPDDIADPILFRIFTWGSLPETQSSRSIKDATDEPPLQPCEVKEFLKRADIYRKMTDIRYNNDWGCPGYGLNAERRRGVPGVNNAVELAIVPFELLRPLCEKQKTHLTNSGERCFEQLQTWLNVYFDLTFPDWRDEAERARFIQFCGNFGLEPYPAAFVGWSKISATRLTETELSVRLTNCLESHFGEMLGRQYDILLLSAVSLCTRADLLAVRNMGELLKELERELSRISGLTLVWK